MLGTNDLLQNPKSGVHKAIIKKGFLEITRNLINLPSKPTLYVMIPPPILEKGQPKDTAPDKDGHGVWRSTNYLPGLIKDLAHEIPISPDHIINLQEVINTDNAAEFFVDYVHPTDKGYTLIAQKVFETIFKDQEHMKDELKDKLFKTEQYD